MFAGLNAYEREQLKIELRRQRDNEMRRQRRVAELRERARRDRIADVERGAPPPAIRDFRLPADVLPDALMIWELCQVTPEAASAAAAVCSELVARYGLAASLCWRHISPHQAILYPEQGCC